MFNKTARSDFGDLIQLIIFLLVLYFILKQLGILNI